MLARACPPHRERATDHALIDFSRARNFRLVVWIENKDQMEIPIADVAHNGG